MMKFNTLFCLNSMILMVFLFLFVFQKTIASVYEENLCYSEIVQRKFQDDGFFSVFPDNVRRDILSMLDKSTQISLILISKSMNNLFCSLQRKELWLQILLQNKSKDLNFFDIPKPLLKRKNFRQKIREQSNVFFQYDCRSEKKIEENYLSVVQKLVITNSVIKTISSKKIDKLFIHINFKKSSKHLKHIVFKKASNLKVIKDTQYIISFDTTPKLKIKNDNLLNKKFKNFFVSLKQLPDTIFEYPVEKFIKSNQNFNDKEIELLKKKLKNFILKNRNISNNNIELQSFVYSMLQENSWLKKIFTSFDEYNNFYASVSQNFVGNMIFIVPTLILLFFESINSVFFVL